MPNSEEEKDQEASEEESEEEIEEEEAQEAEDEELEEPEDEDEEEDIEPEEAVAPTGGAAWGFWRVVFALIIIAVVAVAGWLGWQYVAAERLREQQIAEKEAETKTHLLLVMEKLRAAEESAAAADMNGILDDITSASEALRLALSVAPEDMRGPLDMLNNKLTSMKEDVEQRQKRLQAEVEKEAKAAAETVADALTHVQSIVRQQYSTGLDMETE